MTAITPLGQKIAQCYSHPPCKSHENKYFQETLQNNGTFTEKILLPGVIGTFLKASFGEIKLIYNS